MPSKGSRVRTAHLSILAAGLSVLIGCSEGPARETGVVPESPGGAAAVKAVKPAPKPPAAVIITVPAGTPVAVRLNESLSTEKNGEGDSFGGTLATSLVVDGKELAPAGAPVSGLVYHSQRSGKVKGLAEMGLRLTTLEVGGAKHSLMTENWFRSAKATKKKDAAWIGGGAAAGAIIGAVAGGGKGATIGTAVGGGAGTAKVLATRGEPVVLPSETRVTFRLKEPLQLRAR